MVGVGWGRVGLSLARKIRDLARFTVYRRKGSYRFKTAFPEPYPL